jgi:hypothetical protein
MGAARLCGAEALTRRGNAMGGNLLPKGPVQIVVRTKRDGAGLGQ